MFDTYRNVAPNCDRNSLVPLRASQSTLLCTPPSPGAHSLLERNAIANKIFRKLFHRKSRRRTKEDIMATATATTTTTTATTANALAAPAADPNAPKAIPRQMLNGQMMLKYTNVVKGMSRQRPIADNLHLSLKWLSMYLPLAVQRNGQDICISIGKLLQLSFCVVERDEPGK